MNLNLGQVDGTVSEKLDKVYVEGMVDRSLEQAREILLKIDSAVDRMEGKGVHKAILEIQELLLEWNLVGYNFATMGIQDWIEEK
jgi:hypothetical protein